jgi:nucleotide-binding universal stress UspA family protein
MPQVDSHHGEPPIRCVALALALDGSEPSRDAVRMATQVAPRLDAEVLVMCAIEWHPRYGGAEDAEAVRRDVKALVEHLRTRGVPRAER